MVRNTEKNCLEECQNVTLLQRNQSFSFSETLVECLSGDQCSGIKYFVHFESKLVFVEDVPTSKETSHRSKYMLTSINGYVVLVNFCRMSY